MSASFGTASALPGSRRDPYRSFNFLVEFEGLVAGGFSEVTGLQLETVVETYREGGVNEYEHKLPGPTRYPSNLVLKRGITDLDTLWSWYQDVCSGVVVRRNGAIHLLDNQRQSVMWWDIREAYPVRWTGPELRGDSNMVAAESVELVHRGLSKTLRGDLTRGSSAGAF